MIQPNGALAKLPDGCRGMRNAEERFAGVQQLCELTGGFFMKSYVADAQHLIDYENCRLNMNRDRESQPDGHAGGIRPQRLINELMDLGEIYDCVHHPADLLIVITQQSSV